MQVYQHILVAVDIYSEHDSIIKKALSIAQKPEDVSLVFVTLPSSYFQPYLGAVVTDFSNDFAKEAKARLNEIAKKAGIPEAQTHTPVGDIADEIHTLANELDSDVIVIGTHGRSGLKLLLGSTANEVLHGVKQDVLAVRVHG